MLVWTWAWKPPPEAVGAGPAPGAQRCAPAAFCGRVIVRATLGLLCVAAVMACTQRGVVGPSPALNPTEVIAAQLTALRNNGEDNAGIARAFRFASPGNRRMTGPLPRFAMMIKAQFPEMLTFERMAFGPLRVHGERALQVVILVQPDASLHAYRYLLSRVTTDDCDGCWMIDGVVPLSRDANAPRRRSGVI